MAGRSLPAAIAEAGRPQTQQQKARSRSGGSARIHRSTCHGSCAQTSAGTWMPTSDSALTSSRCLPTRSERRIGITSAPTRTTCRHAQPSRRGRPALARPGPSSDVRPTPIAVARRALRPFCQPRSSLGQLAAGVRTRHTDAVRSVDGGPERDRDTDLRPYWLALWSFVWALSVSTSASGHPPAGELRRAVSHARALREFDRHRLLEVSQRENTMIVGLVPDADKRIAQIETSRASTRGVGDVRRRGTSPAAEAAADPCLSRAQRVAGRCTACG